MSAWFKAKAVLGALGLALGLMGMALDAELVIWVAIAMLGAAFLIRFVEPRKPDAGLNHPTDRG